MSSASSELKKSVSFSSIATVRSIPSFHKFAGSELGSSWLSSQDYKMIRKRERKLAKNFSQNGENLRQSRRHEIGLQTDIDRMEQKTRIQCATVAVLLEQERQWESPKGTLNPEEMARIASIMSQESLLRAQSNAMDVCEQLKLHKSAKGGRDESSNSNCNSILNHYRSSEFTPQLSIANKNNQRWRVISKDSGIFAPLRNTSKRNPKSQRSCPMA